jgi:hypothetical protein
MGTITSANTVLTLSQPILFPTPVQIQQFAADDVTDTDQVRNVEALMGVDGTLSFGFVFAPIMQNISLQANSPSIGFFDTLYAQTLAAEDVYTLQGTIIFPAISKKYNLQNGAMTDYKPTPDAKRTLQPQRFRITWNSVLPSPL